MLAIIRQITIFLIGVAITTLIYELYLNKEKMAEYNQYQIIDLGYRLNSINIELEVLREEGLPDEEKLAIFEHSWVKTIRDTLPRLRDLLDEIEGETEREFLSSTISASEKLVDEK